MKMEKFEISRIQTADKIFLDGIIYEAPKKSQTAIIYVHGLGGAFYGNPKRLQEYAKECKKQGFGFFAFNNRGNNSVVRIDKEENGKFISEDGGCAFEDFSDSIFDIDAVIEEAKKRKYTRILLIGHSTGANKAVYYLYKKPKNDIELAVLSGAVSDVPMVKKILGSGYQKAIKYAQKIIKQNKNELLPQELIFQFATPKRFLSLAKEKTQEDVFQYYLEKPEFRELKSIKIPTLVIIGEMDQYATIKPEKIIEIYKNINKKVDGIIIKNADHSFRNFEKESVREIFSWIIKNK